MSHNPERSDKNCLNCGTTVAGRYCQRCGQENAETKESFWSLVKHFVYDVLHFDGKFFYTLNYLFTKPGFVAGQYVEGRRVSYLHPIRMYLFTSAVFFLLFFSVRSHEIKFNGPSGELSNRERLLLAKDYREKMDRGAGDGVYAKRIALLLDTQRIPVLRLDSLPGYNRQPLVSFTGRSYASAAEYDSVQKSLPDTAKDSWLVRPLIRQAIKVSNQYRGEEILNVFLQILLHKLPYLLFVSLPFFAGILKLLYVRRKDFYYSDHAVFTLYHYIFTFILLLAIMGLNGLQKWSGWGLFGWLTFIAALFWPVHLYLEMKRFYRQSRGKTFVKFAALNLAAVFLFLFLFLLFTLLSIFQL